MTNEDVAKSVIDTLAWGCGDGVCLTCDRFQCLEKRIAMATRPDAYSKAPPGTWYFCFCRCHPGNEYPNPGLPMGASK